jgi:hypothetical protein
VSVALLSTLTNFNLGRRAQNSTVVSKNFLRYFDTIQNLVLSAKPKAGEDDYAQKRQVYIETLKFANDLLDKLRDILALLFEKCHRNLDQIWHAVCLGDDTDIKECRKKFEEDLNQVSLENWPQLSDFEKLLEKFSPSNSRF